MLIQFSNILNDFTPSITTITTISFISLGNAKDFDNNFSVKSLRQGLLFSVENASLCPEFQYEILNFVQQSQCSFMWGLDKVSSNWQSNECKNSNELCKHLNAIVDIYNYFVEFIVDILCAEQLHLLAFPAAEFPEIPIDWNSKDTFEHLRNIQARNRLLNFHCEPIQLER